MYTKEKIRKRSETRRNESTDNNNNTLLFLLIYMVFSVVITHASSFSFSLSLFMSFSGFKTVLFFFLSFLLRRSARQQFLFLNINDDADDTYLFSNCHPVPKLVVFRRVINLRAKN